MGYAEGNQIVIDADAAGEGWFVDSTPLDDIEFTGAASGEMEGFDLLSVVRHELGHVLGLEDVYDSAGQNNVMFGGFAEGERRWISNDQAEGAIAGSLKGVHYAVETWDGGHSSANAWYANINWLDNSAPVDGDDLVFTGTTRLNHSTWGDLGSPSDGDFDINSITFDAAAGAFVINEGGGGTIKLQGDITNNSSNLQTINFNFQLDGANRTVNTDAGDITIGGVISDDGSARGLIKDGSNTLTLTATNTYTGTTTISAGTLEIGGAGTLQSGTYTNTITNNSTFHYNSTANQTISGIISGSGDLNKSNSGTAHSIRE